MNKELRSMLKKMSIRRVDHLPIAAQFCRRIGLIGTVNRAVPSEMEVDVGTVVQAMVLDTLSGRSPIYKLQEFIESHDTTSLLGREIPAVSFNDTTVGRAMDAIFNAGSKKIFSQVAVKAASAFPEDMDMQHVHFDTTSVNVWGDYDVYSEDDPEDRLVVTRGYSKDKRPDLKQFLISMLCVRRNIPVLGSCASGNASDRKLNNELLSRLSEYMAAHGLAQGAFVYVADSALVNESNLELLFDILFITRLPFTYAEAERVVGDAVSEGAWVDVPKKEVPKGARVPAQYQVCDSTVTLYGKEYRAIVVHSDAHDKRRLKRLERRLGESLRDAGDRLRKVREVEYFCREDAEAAAKRLSTKPTRYHSYQLDVKKQVTYARGRPQKNGERKVSSVKYIVDGAVEERTKKINKARREAGCFVLLTNTPKDGDMAHTPADVLAAYKEQHGIERNFGFLKDPLIVNDLFLKKPERIEVLGLILLISLLIWNLMEYVVRGYLSQTGSTVVGLDKRITDRPTSYAMSCMFSGLEIVECEGARQFTKPLTTAQKEYLEALDLNEEQLVMYEGEGNDSGYG
ncbi:MAG: IS1634 family transposase [Candidatus Aegiribacteria sp.]|nr:IS1634 family transposase [Candidatus Aegiribacteria sp.]